MKTEEIYTRDSFHTVRYTITGLSREPCTYWDDIERENIYNEESYTTRAALILESHKTCMPLAHELIYCIGIIYCKADMFYNQLTLKYRTPPIPSLSRLNETMTYAYWAAVIYFIYAQEKKEYIHFIYEESMRALYCSHIQLYEGWAMKTYTYTLLSFSFFSLFSYDLLEFTKFTHP